MKGHGFSDQTLDDIFSDRLVFIRHLMPEAQSVLLCDKHDFKAIMDFLFYSISVCTGRKLSDLLIKSFFDLSKNYGFSWHLGLKHIVTVLWNYGIHPSILDEKYITRELKDHRSALNESKVKLSSRFKFNLPTFFLEKKKKTGKLPPVSEEKFKFVLSKLILFVSEYSIGMPNRLLFRNKSDWSDLCVFLFISILLGTEKRFVQDYRIFESISTMLIYHLDSIPSDYWYCGAGKRRLDKDKKPCFTNLSFPRFLATMIFDFFPGEKGEELLCWQPEFVGTGESGKVRKDFGDHRLNIIHKLDLIPPSYRGNHLRRFLAYYYLHSCLHRDEIGLSEYPTIVDVASKPYLGINATYLRILMHKDYANYSALLVIVKLYDVIVGHETKEDFSPEKIESIQKVRKETLEKLRRKVPSIQSAHKAGNMVIMGQLVNHIQIVIERWKAGCGGD